MLKKPLIQTHSRIKLSVLSFAVLSLYAQALAVPTLTSEGIATFFTAFPKEKIGKAKIDTFDSLFSQAENPTHQFFLGLLGLSLGKEKVDIMGAPQKIDTSSYNQSRTIKSDDSFGSQILGFNISQLISGKGFNISFNKPASEHKIPDQVIIPAAKDTLKITDESIPVLVSLDEKNDISTSLDEILQTINPPVPLAFSLNGNTFAYIKNLSLLGNNSFTISDVSIKDPTPVPVSKDSQDYTPTPEDTAAVEDRKDIKENKITDQANTILAALSKRPQGELTTLTLDGAGGKFFHMSKEEKLPWALADYKKGEQSPTKILAEGEKLFTVSKSADKNSLCFRSEFFGNGKINFSGLNVENLELRHIDPSHLDRIRGATTSNLLISGSNSPIGATEIASKALKSTGMEKIIRESKVASANINPMIIAPSGFIEEFEKKKVITTKGANIIDRILKTQSLIEKKVINILGADRPAEEAVSTLISETKTQRVTIEDFPVTSNVFLHLAGVEVKGLTFTGCPVSSPMTLIGNDQLETLIIHGAHMELYSDQPDYWFSEDPFFQPGEQFNLLVDGLANSPNLRVIDLSKCRIESHMNHFLGEFVNKAKQGAFQNLTSLTLEENGSTGFHQGLNTLTNNLEFFPNLTEVTITVRSKDSGKDTDKSYGKLQEALSVRKAKVVQNIGE